MIPQDIKTLFHSLQSLIHDIDRPILEDLFDAPLHIFRGGERDQEQEAQGQEGQEWGQISVP